MRAERTWRLIAEGVTGILVACSLTGCFLTPAFNKLGITDDFAAVQAKAYIKQAMKDKGVPYATDDQVDAVFDAARAALEGSKEFQEAAKVVIENDASASEINKWSQKIIDSGAVIPATTNTVTQ